MCWLSGETPASLLAGTSHASDHSKRVFLRFVVCVCCCSCCFLFALFCFFCCMSCFCCCFSGHRPLKKKRGCSTSANSTSDNSTSASWPKSKLAEVEINWPNSNRWCLLCFFFLSFFFFLLLCLFYFYFSLLFLVLTHLSLHFVSVLFLFSSPKT